MRRLPVNRSPCEGPRCSLRNASALVGMDQIFELHGLRVRGDLSLGGAAVAGGAADVDVTWRAASAPGVEPPPGELLALGPGQPPYSVVVSDAGVLVRVPGICDVMITDGVMEVASPPQQRELASIVAGGTGLAVLLARRGRCV